jgi:hypothetical protein
LDLFLTAELVLRSKRLPPPKRLSPYDISQVSLCNL